MHYDSEREKPNNKGAAIIAWPRRCGKSQQQAKYLKLHASDQKEQIDLESGIIPAEDQAFIELENRIKDNK